MRKINIKKEALEQEKNNDALAESKPKEISSNSVNNDKTSLLSNRHFKIRDTQENGNMSVRKLKGLKRDSEILFVAPPPPPDDPPLSDVTSTLSKSHQNMVSFCNEKIQLRIGKILMCMSLSRIFDYQRVV